MLHRLIAVSALALAGCTTSPRTEVEVHGPVIVTTYVVGDDCFAERGTIDSGGGNQDVGAGAEVNPAASSGAGQGTVVQAGALDSVLASRVGCLKPDDFEAPPPAK